MGRFILGAIHAYQQESHTMGEGHIMELCGTCLFISVEDSPQQGMGILQCHEPGAGGAHVSAIIGTYSKD